ncbi:RNA polymerase sigma factor [Marinoscillum sp.]|uniref:RNA polymerase sigma factor n=1 Tax=Marinoscillum sp. TaxID=2024838 RepID=UPI003BA97FE3
MRVSQSTLLTKKTNILKLSGDDSFKEWFEEVYEANFERLFRYAFSITKDKELAEDVVSEVFLNIWNKRPDYSNIQELGSYLHISVKHLAIRMASRDLRRFSYSDYDETLQISDAVDPENLLLGKELDELMTATLSGLSLHNQVVYDLAKNKGYTNQQIAEELGISKRTVESHLHLALRKIKERLQEHFKESDKNFHFFTNIGSLSALVISSLLTQLL